jgi:hypothetical protein
VARRIRFWVDVRALTGISPVNARRLASRGLVVRLTGEALPSGAAARVSAAPTLVDFTEP